MTEPTVCPTNIDASGRRRRLVLGVVVLTATLALHFALHTESHAVLLLAIVPALAFGWLCVMQAAGRT